MLKRLHLLIPTYKRIEFSLVHLFSRQQEKIYVFTKLFTFFPFPSTDFLCIPMLKTLFLLEDPMLLKSCSRFEEENQEKSISFYVYVYMCVSV